MTKMTVCCHQHNSTTTALKLKQTDVCPNNESFAKSSLLKKCCMLHFMPHCPLHVLLSSSDKYSLDYKMHISIKTHVGMITSLSNYVGKPYVREYLNHVPWHSVGNDKCISRTMLPHEQTNSSQAGPPYSCKLNVVLTLQKYRKGR